MIQTDIIKAAGIAEQDIQELVSAWEAFQASKNQAPRQKPHIVCTGIYNAGKSTLLNALAGKEIFPTGDIPTTKKIARAEFEGAVYIDTPGLNATEEDDRETRAVYETADFIMFVTNAQNGGLSSAEAMWLNTLKTQFSSLQQRLICVLTHCTQVDSEQLPLIQEKICSDLQKAVSFAPEKVFRVDSITYQNGIEARKPLLIGHSGISELKESLSKYIASAETTLRKAQEDDLDIQRQSLQRKLAQIRHMICSYMEKASSVQQAQVNAVDLAWIKFEKALKKAMPDMQRTFFSYLSINLPQDYEYGYAKTESAAKRALENKLRPIYDARERVLNECIRWEVENIPKRYCNAGMDSAYFAACDRISQVFSAGILEFQKLGIPIEMMSDISVIPELPSNLAASFETDLKDDVVRYNGYYALSEYIDMYASVNYDRFGRYEKGLFGIERVVHGYDYNAGDAVREMEKDMEKRLTANADRISNRLGDIWENFVKQLKQEVNKRKKALKRKVDAHKASLVSLAPNSQQSALDYLNALTKEVFQ